ncbi:MAG: glycosyltransferase family 2 protein [Acidobacteriota bacterium]
MPASLQVAVVIPALNEEEALPLVLRDLPMARLSRVMVVDNGSSDRTAQVAEEAGVEVIREPRRGYGRACQAALAVLSEDPPDIVVILDADHSDHPEELPSLLAPLERNQADLVLGSRVLGVREPGSLPLHARLGNSLATFLIWIRHGRRFTDLGPFRAIRWKALEILQMADSDYGWNVEMQVKAVRLGLRCLEVPVRYRRRLGRSKISGTVRGTLRAGIKILWKACCPL